MNSGHRLRFGAARQRGQAMTEFLVAAVALLPLFLLFPLIAKYQDISHATQMASRYVALEALTRNDGVSTWKSESQLGDEVRRRFYSHLDAPIKTNDVAGNFKAHQNLFWRDPRDEALIKDFKKDVTVTFGQAGTGTSHGDAFKSASDGAPFSMLNGALGLQARGIYTASVSVKLANMPAGLKFYEPFDRIDLSMVRRTSIVIDPWTANGPSQVEGKIMNSAALFPAGQLASVNAALGTAVSVVDAPGLLTAPLLGRLDFWRDVVPEDRLRAPR